MHPDRAGRALSGVRCLIDGVDDALLVLLAARRRLVDMAAACKRSAGQPARDPARERDVERRARLVGERLGLERSTCNRLARLLIEDGCARQGLGLTTPLTPCDRSDLDQGADVVAGRRIEANMPPYESPRQQRWSWLRFLPPPLRLAPLLRHLPDAWIAAAIETAMQRALASAVSSGKLQALTSRRIGIEVSDLGLRWVVSLREGRLLVCGRDAAAEATVSGTATDLLLLASRREDADTLFFQRRLTLTGDTDLGLTARNLLDQLPWEEVPLGLRIVLHRGAGWAQSARLAYQGQSSRS